MSTTPSNDRIEETQASTDRIPTTDGKKEPLFEKYMELPIELRQMVHGAVRDLGDPWTLLNFFRSREAYPKIEGTWTVTFPQHHLALRSIFLSKASKLANQDPSATQTNPLATINPSEMPKLAHSKTTIKAINGLRGDPTALEKLAEAVSSLQAIGQLGNLSWQVDQGLSPVNPPRRCSSTTGTFYTRTRAALKSNPADINHIGDDLISLAVVPGLNSCFVDSLAEYENPENEDSFETIFGKSADYRDVSFGRPGGDVDIKDPKVWERWILSLTFWST